MRHPALTSLAAVAGAAMGVAIWVWATAATGQYRAFLAPLCAVGVAVGIRLGGGRGRRAQALGVGLVLVALAVGQYLSVNALWNTMAQKSPEAVAHRGLIPFDLFLASWGLVRDTKRELVFLGTSLVLVLWLLRAAPAQAGPTTG